MYNKKFISVIIPAAGSGSRMGNSRINKQYRMLGARPMLAYTIDAFEKNEFIDEIILVVKEEDIDYCKELFTKPYRFGKITHIIGGGKERQDSIYKALNKVNQQSHMILIHDGARPFIEQKQINEIIKCLDKEKAAAIGVQVKDTVKVVEQDMIIDTPDRNRLRAIQTPQGFHKAVILEAYKKAYKEGYYGTDDTRLVEKLGIQVRYIEGSYKNIKITTEEDILIANAFLKNKGENKSMRTGLGYDVHQLVEGRKLILGGVEINHSLGLLGHSDADVLIHAIMDALLGACALGDIGKHFPDTDEKYKGISSLLLLGYVKDLILENGYQIQNIDSVIIAQKPKLAPYIDKMRENIAKTLGIDIADVGIKATTTEKLGFAGRQEGIATQAIATVY